MTHSNEILYQQALAAAQIAATSGHHKTAEALKELAYVLQDSVKSEASLASY